MSESNEKLAGIAEKLPDRSVPPARASCASASPAAPPRLVKPICGTSSKTNSSAELVARDRTERVLPHEGQVLAGLRRRANPRGVPEG